MKNNSNILGQAIMTIAKGDDDVKKVQETLKAYRAYKIGAWYIVTGKQIGRAHV